MSVHLYVKAVLNTGNNAKGHGLEAVEKEVLESQATRQWVQTKSLERRGMTHVAEYDDNHEPGVLRRVIIPKGNGKTREAWAPTNNDYAQALYRACLCNSLLEATAHPNTHGFRGSRSYRTAIQDLIGYVGTQGVTAITQIDIQDCFPTITLAPIRGLLRGRLGAYIELVQRRGAEAMRRNRIIGNGMPQGHPIAPAVATMVIDRILEAIRERWISTARIIIYADDISIVAKDHTTAIRVGNDIGQEFARYGMRIHPDKTSHTDVTKGQMIEVLGHEVHWRRGQHDPAIAPRQRAFERLAEKVAAAIGTKQISAIIDGWLNAYSLSNDPNLIHRMNEAIAKGRQLSSNTNDVHSAPLGGFFSSHRSA